MAREWWESGVFSADMGRVLFDAKTVAAAAGEVRDLGRLLRLKKGARVLDAACGIGRHSLEFARLGHAVMGVDVTAAYVAEAARSAKREKLKLASFERGELRDLYRFQNSFDLAVNLYNSFGYYRSEKDNFEALKQLSACLRPGGSLVIDLIPAESIRANFQARSWREVEGGYLMEKRAWADSGRRLRNEWILAIKGGFREFRWDLRLYSVAEIKALFRRIGLKQVRGYRDYQGRPWALGQRLVITGVK